MVNGYLHVCYMYIYNIIIYVQLIPVVGSTASGSNREIRSNTRRMLSIFGERERPNLLFWVCSPHVKERIDREILETC